MVVGKDSLSRKVFVVSNTILLSLLAFTCLLPIINLLAISLSDKLPVTQGKVGIWPVGWNFQAYEHVYNNERFIGAFLNSVKLVVLSVIFNLTIVILCAFPMSRNDSEFKGRYFYVWYFVITMLFGGGMLPLFMVVKFTGLMGTHWSLIIPTMVNVFHIFMLMHFFRGIPREVEESAFIDGANLVQVMFRILVPMAKPAIATLILFNFIFQWNNYFTPLIYLNDRSLYPLASYLQTIIAEPDMSQMRSKEEIKAFANMSGRTINAAQIFASMIPVLIVYPFLQKYFAKGIVLGSVKG